MSALAFAMRGLPLLLSLASALVAYVLVRRRRLKPFSTAIVALGALPLGYFGLTELGVLSDAHLRFHEPLGLVGCVIISLFGAFRLSALPGRMSRLRRGTTVTFTTLALLAGPLAFADPELGRPLDRLTVLVAVDRSRSIDLVPGADSRIASELRLAEEGMKDGDRIGTIAFASEAAVEDPPRPRSDLPSPQRVQLGRDGTNIERAIRRALAEVPSDAAARIIVISDGVETHGDAIAAATTAVGGDVPIDTIALDQREVPDLRVMSVRAPGRVNEGEPLDLRVVTRSPIATEVEVRIKRDGVPLRTSRGRVSAGEDVLRLRETATDSGLHRYDVEVTALTPGADGSAEDNSGAAFVRVRGASIALLLEGEEGRSDPLAHALAATGFKTVVKGLDGFPADLGELAGYDLVTLSGISAVDLVPTQLEALASYARDLGGGLLLVGSDKSFGPGGYARTPIEEVSPVDFDLKKEKRRGSLSEVIAIDYSGSMGAAVAGQTKLALANEAAAKSASLLGPGDRLGVEHVDTAAAWTVPMQPVKDPADLGRRIRGVAVGGGGIYTDLALDEGYKVLRGEKTNLKHLLLFADGGDAEQISGCRAIVLAASRDGITTSVISLGRGGDTPELEQLSKAGGGRFYLIEDATKLPAVFTQETILASRSAIQEKPFHVSLGAPLPATRGIALSEAPSLQGYVITEPKPRATVGLLGLEGDPVLATWAVGVGHVGVFTSDYKDKWAASWLQWDGATKMMGQLGRELARKPEDSRVRVESDATGGELHVRADVVGDDGRSNTFRRFMVHVGGPDGFSREVPLEAVGPGRYAASVPLSRPGTYVAAAKDEATGDAVGTTGAVLTAGEELRPTGSNRTLLARLSALTGGRVRDTLAGLFDDRATKRFAYTPLQGALLLLAYSALLLAVAGRRLGVPERLVAWYADVARRASESTAEREARQARRAEEEGTARREREARNEALRVAKQRTQAHNAGRSILDLPPREPTNVQAARSEAPVKAAEVPPTTSAPPARELTVAERLAQKRRERR